jgi:hypothetical protein
MVAMVLLQDDRMLLCHRSPSRRWYPDVWNFPGGHVEPGERPEGALRRDIAEELGADLTGVDGDPNLRRVVPETDWTSLCGSRASGRGLSRTGSQSSTTPSAGSRRTSRSAFALLIRPTCPCSRTCREHDHRAEVEVGQDAQGNVAAGLGVIERGVGGAGGLVKIGLDVSLVLTDDPFTRPRPIP